MAKRYSTEYFMAKTAIDQLLLPLCLLRDVSSYYKYSLRKHCLQHTINIYFYINMFIFSFSLYSV